MREGLLKIGDLVERTGVPRATIKYYLRERLIAPCRRSGRTMSWYAPETVDKILAIKDLQERQFLPLEVIRRSIARHEEAADDLAAAEAIAKVLEERRGHRARSRDEVLAAGGNLLELELLARMGLAVPDAKQQYRGDDLALLSTLGAARKAGLAAEMLPFDILRDYLAALRALVAVELRLFREGVIKRAKPGDVAKLTTAATHLSERLVVLLRRKLLLPTLNQMIATPAPAPKRTRTRGKPKRRA